MAVKGGTRGVWRLIRHLDRRAAGTGAAAYLAIAAPCGVAIAVFKGNDSAGQESGFWVVAAVLVLLVAPLVGGAVAGRARPDAPLVHGVAAVAVPAALFLVVRSVVGAAQGRLTLAQGISFVLFVQVFTGLAMAGAYVGSRPKGARS